MSKETNDHRERRLTQLGEAVEALLNEGWSYMLILGKPGDAKEALQVMVAILGERQAKGQKPTEI
jgi:hypothetical protein